MRYRHRKPAPIWPALLLAANVRHHTHETNGAAGDIGDIDVGLATPMEVYQSLAAEGYQMSHKRAPLSRERTPEAADLDTMHHQLLIQPEGERLLVIP